VQAHLRSRLARLLISSCPLLGADDLATLSVAHYWCCAFAFCLICLLESGFHVPGKRQLPYEGQEPFTAKDRTKDLLRVDEATLRSALLGSKFVILVPELRVGERLVGDCNRFEELFRIRVVAILVRVVFDCEATCRRPLVSQLGMDGI
jgi:hypothetical protein